MYRLSVLTLFAAVVLTGGIGSSQYLEATIPVTGGATDILWNPTSNKVYVANNQYHSVTIIDGATNQVRTTIPVSDYPIYLACNPQSHRVYCTSGESDRLTVIDGAGDSIVKTVRLSGYPCMMQYNSILNKLYVLCYDSRRIAVLDAGPDTLIRYIELSAPGPSSLLWSRWSNRLFCSTNYYDTTIAVIDCVADEIVLLRSLPGYGAFLGCVNESNGEVYVTTRYSLHVLSSGGDSVIASIQGPGSAAYSPSPNKIFQLSGHVHVIDGEQHTVIDSVAVVGWYLLCDTVKMKVYIINYNEPTAWVVDAWADTLIESLPVGGGPEALCWNRTNSRVYVLNSSVGTVSVIRDTTTGVAERAAAGERRAVRSAVARGIFFCPGTWGMELLDATGRVAMILKPGRNSVAGLAPGVYFAVGRTGRDVTRVTVLR